jgi:hypothetical protein
MTLRRSWALEMPWVACRYLHMVNRLCLLVSVAKKKLYASSCKVQGVVGPWFDSRGFVLIVSHTDQLVFELFHLHINHSGKLLRAGWETDCNDTDLPFDFVDLPVVFGVVGFVGPFVLDPFKGYVHLEKLKLK